MKLKAAVFDFDGTLFDSMYVWDTAGERYLRSVGRTPAPTVRDDIAPLSLHQAACFFQEAYALDLPVAEIMAGINRTIEQAYFHEILPKPGVAVFLDDLQHAGVAMCIATATDRYLVSAALERCGLAGRFSGLFTCSEVGHGKDEPVIFRRAMESLGADRGATIVFEDAYHAIRTAKEDGFLTAAVFDPSEARQDAMRSLGDCYLTDYAHTEPFWKLAAAD